MGKFGEAEFSEEAPEPKTMTELMRCFNAEMESMGLGCCGRGRGIEGMAFLEGLEDSFNHHECKDMERNPAWTKKERKVLQKNCFVEGMFAVHSKSADFARTSLELTTAFVKISAPDLGDAQNDEF